MSTCQTIDSTPECVNWRLDAGTTRPEHFEFLADGDPVDMTGWEVSASARARVTDPDVALTAACTPVDAARGQWTVRWDPAEVRALLGAAASWTGVWDLEAVEPGGDAVTMMRGTLTLSLDVTREAVR